MKLYTLRFFPFRDDNKEASCLCTVEASEIPKKGQLVYLGNDTLLDNGTVYLVKRTVRCYSRDSRDLKDTGGDCLVSIEIDVVPTTVNR